MRSPYSLTSYHNLMQGLLNAGYSFIGYDQVTAHSPLSPQCLLRHDIDADLSAALQIAQLEAELGIKSTYFLMTRSPVYNLLSRHNHRIVEQIIGLGHAIGLHYDRGFGGNDNGRHGRLLDLEAEFIEQLFDIAIHSVSFHQPDAEILAGKVSTAPRINTYDKTALSSYTYYSDSNRSLRLGTPDWKTADTRITTTQLSGQSIQLLLHPMWWVYDEFSTVDVWDQAILSNFEMMQQQCLATERAYGPRRNMTLIRSEHE
ncbi:hypothetical protein [Herbaspirillum sp.]|uniref:hypothetical protein n=1 Tax=Herbaspirillum sp. TaxID=1890675 RepID=UPI001B285D1B|nr:hypothetical protein [Herbaspirillum sp.]MBO9536961.1 hypothetical protein [Herbaspirillum sp.]